MGSYEFLKHRVKLIANVTFESVEKIKDTKTSQLYTIWTKLSAHVYLMQVSSLKRLFRGLEKVNISNVLNVNVWVF